MCNARGATPSTRSRALSELLMCAGSLDFITMAASSQCPSCFTHPGSALSMPRFVFLAARLKQHKRRVTRQPEPSQQLLTLALSVILASGTRTEESGGQEVIACCCFAGGARKTDGGQDVRRLGAHRRRRGRQRRSALDDREHRHVVRALECVWAVHDPGLAGAFFVVPRPPFERGKRGDQRRCGARAAITGILHD